MIDRLFRLAGCKYAVPERQLDETVPVPRRKPTSLSLSIFLLSTSRSNLPFVKALGQTSLRQISGKVFKQYLVVNKTSKETISDHVNHCSVTNFAILYSEIELSIFLLSTPRSNPLFVEPSEISRNFFKQSLVANKTSKETLGSRKSLIIPANCHPVPR